MTSEPSERIPHQPSSVEESQSRLKQTIVEKLRHFQTYDFNPHEEEVSGKTPGKDKMRMVVRLTTITEVVGWMQVAEELIKDTDLITEINDLAIYIKERAEEKQKVSLARIKRNNELAIEEGIITREEIYFDQLTPGKDSATHYRELSSKVNREEVYKTMGDDERTTQEELDKIKATLTRCVDYFTEQPILTDPSEEK